MQTHTHIKTILALVRKYGLRKTWNAYQDSSDDSNYVLADCPHCNTEHRIHKLRAARGMTRCKKCKELFITVMTEEDYEFIQVFGKGRR